MEIDQDQDEQQQNTHSHLSTASILSSLSFPPASPEDDKMNDSLDSNQCQHHDEEEPEFGGGAGDAVDGGIGTSFTHEEISQLYKLHHGPIDFGPGIDETSMYEDMLTDDSTLNFSKIEPRISEFRDAIIKRDNIIKKLVDSHETLQQQLEEAREEIRQTEPVAEELERVKDSLQQLVESSAVIRNNQLIAIGDNSSYLSLPELSAPRAAISVAVADANVGTEPIELGIERNSPVAPANCSECHEVGELRLQVIDLERKLEARIKYLDEVTTERENERDEYHRDVEVRDARIEELRREREKLQDNILQQKIELDDFELRLKDADEVERELVNKSQKTETELQSAIDKVYELREIIRDLEEQIDSAANNASKLKDQNQLLNEEVENLENKLRDQEDVLQTTQETIVSSAQSAEIEEIQTQITDLSSRIEKKLGDLDNFPWSTRSSSSCSGGLYVSNEDVSVKELSNNMSRTLQAATPFLIAEGLCRLEAHFESLLRFEEIIMKKLKDNEIRFGMSKKRQEELESEKVALQETMKEQILKISDMQSRLDQFRFEPSPNAVTLSGLRSRVQFLSEQVEEYKGQLQLKLIENQDIEHKLASSQALLAKYTSHAQSNTRKTCAIVQTDDLRSQSSSSVQTDPVKIMRQSCLKTREAEVQTTANQCGTSISKNTGFDALDFSTIHGEPPPVHSTPKDPIESISNKRTPRGFASVMERATPEQLRDGDNKFQFSPPFGTSLKRDDVISQIITRTPLQVRTSEEELRCAIEKIGELQKTIRDLEEQTNSSANNASKLKNQNQLLNEEVESLENKLREQEEALQTTKETIVSSIQNQITDLSYRIEKKLGDFNNFVRSTGPNGSRGQYLSSEDVSVKELSNNTSPPLQAATPFLIADGLCRLEAHFGTLLRLEEIIMKKLKDNEIKFGMSKNRQDELESEKGALQETMKEHILKISDMQSSLQFLSEEVEEYKGQLQLKLIENQDIEHKLASSQALLAKYTSHSQPNTRKTCAIVQTDDLRSQRSSSVQTEPVIMRQYSLKTNEAAVQATANQLGFSISENALTEALPYSTETVECLPIPTRRPTESVRFTGTPLGHVNNALPVELYLRTKSHRKALCWQKKYLTIVIHGYKDLLCASGAGFQHPDFLQKELPIVPSAVGLIDRNDPFTRFRITVKAVIAMTRMKFMVRRWNNKLHQSSRLSSCSKENYSPLTPFQEKATKPPISLTGNNRNDHHNVLAQYLQRFQNLENEIGQTIGIRTRSHHK